LQKITPAIASNYPAAALTDLTPVFKNIRFENIVATVQNGKRAGLIWGLPEAPASDIVLQNVKINASGSFGIFFAKNIQLNNCSIVSQEGKNQLSLANAEVITDGKK